MRITKILIIPLLALTICHVPVENSYAGPGGAATIVFPSTDNNVNPGSNLFYFFDLRERETFIQLTYPDTELTGLNGIAHIQIFNVNDDCNENDFFDTYTPADTHTYNMRDIQTNDGTPSGVVLPDGAYGIVVVVMRRQGGVDLGINAFPVGNQRVLDNNGYEYRTNAQSINIGTGLLNPNLDTIFSFNFNQKAGVTFSDVVGITAVQFESFGDWVASDPIVASNSFDVDIYDLNEVPFSCRDVIFACVNENNPRLEELLEVTGTASVASFEYGINNAIPHSKGGELLCPGNIIGEGIVVLTPEIQASENQSAFLGYVGLNNGNGRGSFDSFWYYNFLTVVQPPPPG